LDPTREPTRLRRAVRTGLAWALLGGLVAWLASQVSHVSWRELLGSVRPPPWWAWVLSAAGLAASYACRGLRIHAELSRRHPVTRGECLRVMLLHNAAVNVVPMRGGEAAYPLLVHRRLGVPLGQAVASLVWIRAQDMLLLALLLVLFLPRFPLWARGALAVLVLAGVLVAIALVQRFVARRAEAAPPRSKLLRTALAALEALSDAPRHGLAGWLFGAGSWAVKLAALGLLLAHLGGFPWLDAVTGALWGELAGILPIQGPANFGTYEAGVAAGVAVFGRSVLQVAAPALALHLFSLASALVAGALAWIFSPRGSPAPPPEADHA
jgi:uncharacterized membrane protein YbhN (UPF0104 family)